MNGTEYDIRANEHRPTDIDKLRCEIRRLSGEGLTERDIADALRMHLHDVINILAGNAP